VQIFNWKHKRFLVSNNSQVLKFQYQTLQICSQDYISSMALKKSGQIIRLELEGTKLIESYPQMAQRFKYAGWFEFLTTFQGHDEQISMIFAQNFVGFEVVIGKLLRMVTEH
jgi:hypothetical protein